MDTLMVENEVSDTGEESFLLAYLFLLGSFLYLLWLRRDKTNVRPVRVLDYAHICLMITVQRYSSRRLFWNNNFLH